MPNQLLRYRHKYNLCRSNTKFFQPFSSIADVHQQVKTTLITPVIGLFSMMNSVLSLLENILIMAVSIPCLSPSLFCIGLNEGLTSLKSAILNPLIASAITLASLVSLITRSLATAIYGVSNAVSEVPASFHSDFAA